MRRCFQNYFFNVNTVVILIQALTQRISDKKSQAMTWKQVRLETRVLDQVLKDLSSAEIMGEEEAC
jgi:hypothetical protein